MQNIDQCIKPALLIVNFFYINVKIDLVKRRCQHIVGIFLNEKKNLGMSVT